MRSLNLGRPARGLPRRAGATVSLRDGIAYAH
jgi:hypothetical protein